MAMMSIADALKSAITEEMRRDPVVLRLQRDLEKNLAPMCALPARRVLN